MNRLTATRRQIAASGQRDKIAGDTAHFLKPYLPPRDRKLRLPDICKMFEEMSGLQGEAIALGRDYPGMVAHLGDGLVLSGVSHLEGARRRQSDPLDDEARQAGAWQ